MTPTDIPCATFPAPTSGAARQSGRHVSQMGRAIARRIGERRIDEARVTVSGSRQPSFDDFLPDGRARCSALDRAVARGPDVRLLGWRPNAETAPSPRMFLGGLGRSSANWLAHARGRASRNPLGIARRRCVPPAPEELWGDRCRPAVRTDGLVGGLNLTASAMRRPTTSTSELTRPVGDGRAPITAVRNAGIVRPAERA